MKSLGFSSEIYNLSIRDLASIPEKKIPNFIPKNKNIVYLLLGNTLKSENDSIIFGKELIKESLIRNQKYIQTRVVFVSQTPYLNFISSFLKFIRNRNQAYSPNIYKIPTSDITENTLERNIRTFDNAYNYTNKKWMISVDQRKKKLADLQISMERFGYNFTQPLHVMLCRSLGSKDKLHQGHHRMMMVRMLKIDEVSIQFVYASRMPVFLQIFFLQLIQITKYKQAN